MKNYADDTNVNSKPYSALLWHFAHIVARKPGKLVIVGIAENEPLDIRHIINDENVVANAVAAISAIEQRPGFNVYFYPGLMRADLPEGSKGKTKDVMWLAFLWADFDGGEWTYESVEARAPYYMQHGTQTSTGNFQVLWGLDRPYTSAEAVPVLAALVNATGCDPAVKNVDRIMRVPGTMNYPSSDKVERYRKRGVTRVPEIGKVITAAEDWEWGCITLESFKAKLSEKYPNAFDNPTRRETDFDWDTHVPGAAHRPFTADEAGAFLNDETRCAGDRSAAMYGFYGACKARGYTPEQTAKLACEHSDTWAMGHFDGSEKRLRDDVANAWPKIEPKAGSAESELPGGFVRLDSGIYSVVLAKKEGEESEYQFLCTPLRFIATARDPGGLGYGKLIEIHQPDGRVVELFCPDVWLTDGGEKLRSALIDRGVRLATGRNGNGRVCDLFMRVKPGDRMVRTDKTGWRGDEFAAFVLPDGVIGYTGGERILFTGKSVKGYGTAGTIQEWQANVVADCEDCSRLALALAAAFAAPLLNLLRVEGGGVHLWGDSSTGKTTAAKVAASVWGDGDYWHSWRFTDNALEAVAEAHNDTLLVLDELKLAMGETVSNAAYMLAGGRGKARMNINADIKRVAEWRTLFFSTGEMSLATRIRQSRVKDEIAAGQTVRVLELPADAGKGYGVFDTLPVDMTGKQFADMLQANTKRFYGTAGRAFIEWLLKNRAGAIAMAQDRIEQFERDNAAKIEDDPQMGRVAARFGLLYAALILAVKAGVLPWQECSCADAVDACFSAWLGHRGHSGGHEAVRASELIDGFLAAQDARFEDWEDAPPTQSVIGLGSRRSNATKGRRGGLSKPPITFCPRHFTRLAAPRPSERRQAFKERAPLDTGVSRISKERAVAARHA